MIFYSESFSVSAEELHAKLQDTHFVTDGIHFEEFEEKDGYPAFSVREMVGFSILTCKMTGGATKDNGFLVGSFFFGRIKSTATGAKLSGIIATAPIYHAVLLGFVIFAMIRAFLAGGLNILPLCIVAFDVFLFAKEFHKQSILLRYLRVLAKKLSR